ncbi:MAG TPA: hypothetical protein VMU87_20830 [Stellaceae bacterium]|nr:hypothetical protein [Stellaceae bacterium]
MTLILDPCTDRTGTKDRDLAKEATEAFRTALSKIKDFVVAADGRYRLTCEVTDYQEGSAFTRWLLPGRGQTVGKISAIVTDAKTGETQTIIVGEARVRSGGFYTIGAYSYIMSSAVDEVVKKLDAWAHGEVSAAPTLRPFEHRGRTSEDAG